MLRRIAIAESIETLSMHSNDRQAKFCTLTSIQPLYFIFLAMMFPTSSTKSRPVYHHVLSDVSKSIKALSDQ